MRKSLPAQEYTIKESGITAYVLRKNIKNMYLRVKKPEGRVEISAPLQIPDSQIRRFIRLRLEWITAAQRKVQNVQTGQTGSQPPAEAPVEAPFMERENRRRLTHLLEKLIAKYEPVMGVRSAGFTIKKMKTRWGSCNVRTGHLNFNYALCRLPEKYVEYVVVHELTHLLEPSHNARFWALTERFLPGARQLNREMKQLTAES